MIKTEKELAAKIKECTSCLEDKFNGKDGKRSIIICGGTGCLSSNSQEILDKFEALIKENKCEDKVSVNKVGCFGFCSQGPFVKIFPEDTLYRLVKIDDVLLKKKFKNKKILLSTKSKNVFLYMVAVLLILKTLMKL